MTHLHKVALGLTLSLVIAVVCAYVVIDYDWFTTLLSIDLSKAPNRFGLFALFFIIVFDFLVLMFER